MLRWQRVKGRFNINVDRTALLSNFQTMELRIDHVINISETMEQFGHFVKAVYSVVSLTPRSLKLFVPKNLEAVKSRKITQSVSRRALL